MITEVTRADAIRYLAEQKMRRLDPSDRKPTLMNWWGLSEGDTGYDTLPAELQQHLQSADEPERPLDPIYDPLLRVAMAASYKGVPNEYMEREVLQYSNRQVHINGEPEQFFACRCCRYRSLERRGDYEICKVCLWQDDGTTAPEGKSPLNRMTLGQGRANFARYGACNPESAALVDKEGPKKYSRAAADED